MPGKIVRMRVPAAQSDPCDGCHDCALRCAAGLQMTKGEFEEIVAHLRTLDPDRVRRVLEQEKVVPWFEEITRECCLFLDVVKQDCLIYPARPLICRLFGRVEWLPCPAGKVTSQLKGGWDIVREYAREPRLTFPQWQMETGLLDLRSLLRK